MKMTQGLIPSSSGITNGVINEIFSKPDKHGGYEFGTWDFDHSNYFSKILNGLSYNDLVEKETPFAVCVRHRFTEEERVIISASLKKDWKSYKGGIGKTLKIKIEKNIMEKEALCELTLETKWYKRLVELFSNPNDLPVYYFYD